MLELAERAARPRVGQGPVDQAEATSRVCPFARVLVGQQPPAHLVDRPGHGRHRGDAEALVDLGAPGVVDARHDVGDLVGLAGDAHGQDVGVVAARDRSQGVRVEGARLLEVVAVEPRAHQTLARPSP